MYEVLETPDDLESLTLAIKRIEAALRSRPPSPDRRRAIFIIIAKLKAMRAHILEERVRRLPH
jgi:hypothetical protein